MSLAAGTKRPVCMYFVLFFPVDAFILIFWQSKRAATEGTRGPATYSRARVTAAPQPRAGAGLPVAVPLYHDCLQLLLLNLPRKGAIKLESI